MTRNRTLNQSLKIVESTEDKAVRDVANVYSAARRELIARLLETWDATDPANQATQRIQTLGVLGEVDQRIAQLEADTGEVLRSAVVAQDEIALQSIRAELALLEEYAEIAAPRLTSVEFALIERNLPVVTDALTFWSQGLRLQLRQELQNGLIQGESFDSLVRRVMANRESVWARGRVSAELMVRRTVITANNAARTDYIAQVVDQVPQVQKQAIATIAGNTTKCCLAVHGQIRDVDEPFALVERPKYADEMMYPSFHWRCRTTTAMYHPVFEQQGGLTTESMRTAADKELRSR